MVGIMQKVEHSELAHWRALRSSQTPSRVDQYHREFEVEDQKARKERTQNTAQPVYLELSANRAVFRALRRPSLRQTRIDYPERRG